MDVVYLKPSNHTSEPRESLSLKKDINQAGIAPVPD
jgi:hypothetical protein